MNEIPSSTQKTLILIVDDEPSLRMLLQTRLEKKGFEVAFASDGQDAWTKLSAGLKPALVISDMKMPHLDGVDLLKKIRDQNQIRTDLPFIFMTGFPERKMQDMAQELGCIEIMLKPFSFNALVTRIESFFANEKNQVSAHLKSRAE